MRYFYRQSHGRGQASGDYSHTANHLSQSKRSKSFSARSGSDLLRNPGRAPDLAMGFADHDRFVAALWSLTDFADRWRGYADGHFAVELLRGTLSSGDGLCAG